MVLILTVSGVLFAACDDVEPTPYTVTFNNVRTDEHDNAATFTADDLSVALTPAARAGYEFLGWFDNAQFEGAAVTAITQPGNVAFWARWSAPIQYTVTFNNVATTEHTNRTAFTVRDLSTSNIILTSAARTGFRFLGWFDNAQFEGAAVTAITQIGNVELWARWEALTRYTITYHSAAESEHNNPDTFTEDILDIALTPAERAGHYFVGWFTQQGTAANGWDWGTRMTAVTQTGDVVLWARWTTEYTITFNGIEYATHDNPAVFTVYDLDLTLTSAEKAGYHFLGWFDAEQNGNIVTEITQTGNVILWARWRELVEINLDIQISVVAPAAFIGFSFRLERGEDVIEYGYGDDFHFGADITRTAYAFVGDTIRVFWRVNDGFETVVDINSYNHTHSYTYSGTSPADREYFYFDLTIAEGDLTSPIIINFEVLR